MTLLLLLFSSLLVGCARSSVAALVPRLELGLRTTRAHPLAREAERRHLVVGAWLRWEPLVTDPSAGSALSAAAALTPCEVGDAACLTEHTEAEPEIAALRVGAP